MQPISRAVSRVGWKPARLGVGSELTARHDSSFITREARQRLSSICLRCRIQATASPRRFYSSKSPSDDPTQSPTSNPNPGNDSPSTPNTTFRASAELPSVSENRRSPVNQRFSHLMDTLQSRVLTASKTLNELTGYTGIEAIKNENTVLEKSLADAQTRVRLARQAYKTSNSKRGNTQREVTTLLARKDSWSPADLERFTELYRTDHVLDGEVAAAQENLTEAEVEEQSLTQRLNAGILRRYHEEQIWSDRIRRASTWGTWGLMGMNFLLFFVIQFIAEPWKRRRLVNGVVAEEKEILGEVRDQLETVKAALAQRNEVEAVKVEPAVQLPPPAIASEVVEQEARPAMSWSQLLTQPPLWKAATADLFSERRAELRMRDVSIVALEGVATGAAIAASIAWALAGR